MLKFIRNKAPFILLACNILFIVCKYFGVYKFIFPYLGDLVGYSILTNLFMYSVYMNKKYCTAVKFAVIGLTILNVLSIIWNLTGIDGTVYDFFLILIVAIVLLAYKYKF